MHRNLVYILGVLAGGAAGGAPAFSLNRLVTSVFSDDRALAATPAPSAPQLPTAVSDEPGRWGAESPELRALRRAEAVMFRGGEAEPAAALDPVGAPVCELPREEEAWYSPRGGAAPPSPSWGGLTMSELSSRKHPAIARYVRYFSANGEGRKSFTTWLRRSGRYRELIGRALRERDLPHDLLAVVFIESGFWPTAVSSAGAVGLWQFMPETGRAYGLKVERSYDERQSIFQSTRAAADHLADLHARFQSWELALAAYNTGYRRLSELMQRSATDDFWQLREVSDALPRETALYVPKVLAVAVLLNNLERFGFDEVDLLPTADATDIEVQPGTRLSLIARAAGTSVRNLRDLNPHLRGDVLPDRGEPLSVYVPSRGVARAREMLPLLLARQDKNELDRQVSSDFDWSRDEPGVEGLSRLERTDPVARRRARLDDLEDDSARGEPGPIAERAPRIRDDEDVRPSRLRAEDASRAPRTVPRLTEGERLTFYRVARGDTLSDLALAFNTTEQELALENGLGNPSKIVAGQLLRLTSRRHARAERSASDAPSNEAAPGATPSR